MSFMGKCAGVALAVAVSGSASAAVLTTGLSLGHEEEPHVVNFTPVYTNWQPRGGGMVTYDTDTRVLSWQISYWTTGPVTAGHVHGPAAPGVGAGVVFPILTPPEPAIGLIAGSKDLDDLANPAAAEADLFAGLWYINLHTSQNPAGEIRGQIVGIPEPASLALLGLGGLAMVSRRRQA